MSQRTRIAAIVCISILLSPTVFGQRVKITMQRAGEAASDQPRPERPQQVTRDNLAAYYQFCADSNLPIKHPHLYVGSSTQVGEVGTIHSGVIFTTGRGGESAQVFELLQKLSDNSALVRVTTHSTRASGFDTIHSSSDSGVFLFKGIDCSKLADNSTLELNGTFAASGTESYQTVAGSTATTMVIEPTTLPPPPTYPQAIGMKPRTWKDNTGNYEVIATYVGYEKGAAMLQTDAGKTINVPVGKLDRESQRFVREHVKFEKEYDPPR